MATLYLSRAGRSRETDRQRAGGRTAGIAVDEMVGLAKLPASCGRRVLHTSRPWRGDWRDISSQSRAFRTRPTLL